MINKDQTICLAVIGLLIVLAPLMILSLHIYNRIEEFTVIPNYIWIQQMGSYIPTNNQMIDDLVYPRYRTIYRVINDATV